MTTTSRAVDIRPVLDQISRLQDDYAVHEILVAAHERLTRLELAKLARLLTPVISGVQAREDAHARQLVVRAVAFEPTRSQPQPVRYSADGLYLPLASRHGREWIEQLTVPQDLQPQAEAILRGLTNAAVGSLAPGEELYLQLP
ncbi:hypothetical protein SZN_01305 [Streptomyces zinciresistens K42]|uniref:Uncharacterized protein n=1 Tax=Streptomyces zinciresistens K42 TaxID=700597 RepID=G2G460_9ACTN|nr:hypothetical protein [Streptomyces zinciresistens]EGX61956.1 hypothetical protein SZN_01305 [Streptomyces zinciresistens K42]